MKITYNSHKIVFSGEDLLEQSLLSECLEASKIDTKKGLSLHQYIKGEKTFKQEVAFTALSDWGLEPSTGVEKVNEMLMAFQRRYRIDVRSVEEVMTTPEYAKALERIEDMFGQPFVDGSSMFPFQKEAGAVFQVKKRMLLAFEMGLGKTRTSLVAMLSDPTCKKIIIVTMSRNVNDWLREVELLGYKDDCIVLEKPGDLQSDKKIHLVSYEKWAADRITFKHKVLETCPCCGMKLRLDPNGHRIKGYCSHTKRKYSPIVNERWTEEDMPEHCPDCNHPWKGTYQCQNVARKRVGGHFINVKCNYSVIEKRKKPLSHYYHHGYTHSLIDEAHYIKNLQSKRAQSILRITAPKRLALSGTPAENGADDLFSILAWLTGCTSRFEDPLENGPFQMYGRKGIEHFREHYSGGKKRRVLDIDSVEPRASNLQGLWAILDSLMIRKKQADREVAKYLQVPKPEHHRVHLPLHAAERELYDNLLEAFKEWYEFELIRKQEAEDRGDSYRISTIEICTWMDKLRKAASSPWQFAEYDAAKGGNTTAKLDYLRSNGRNLLMSGQKFLVFSGHKNTVEELSKLLNGLYPGKEAVFIHGGVAMKDRWEFIRRFQDPNDPLSVIVFSHKTGAGTRCS
ncbi:SNF2-related protein [Aneurinibacillus tyrosinisolvens]|uniref:SNF2-related protein n=1 Tax=Aneurinibacillus tyrosinisolvens TaxID=1443435 RepID=UPI00063F5E87|nr:DEAD/DEAH box helicase [Aneurinibacillus tyrosinisolvens]